MLRFKILASTFPLVLAAVFARGGFAPATQPCIAMGETTARIAASPWQAQSQVSFTDDSRLATVRVQIVDSAETADFAVVDDIQDSGDGGTCRSNAATRLIGITATPAADAAVIYLSQDGNADYRIFVTSNSFTPRDAAALVVGAHGGPGHGDAARMAAAAL
jgi:hypoxanthine phosphoribosyltransferase